VSEHRHVRTLGAAARLIEQPLTETDVRLALQRQDVIGTQCKTSLGC